MDAQETTKKTKKKKKSQNQNKKEKVTKESKETKVQSQGIEYTVKPELLDDGQFIRITCTCIDHGFKTIFQQDFTFDKLKELSNHHYSTYDNLEAVYDEIQERLQNEDEVKLTNLTDNIDFVIEYSKDDIVSLTLKKIFAGPYTEKKKKEKKNYESYIKTIEILKSELSKIGGDSEQVPSGDNSDLEKKLKEKDALINKLMQELQECKKQLQAANNKLRKKDGELEEKDLLISELQDELNQLRESMESSLLKSKKPVDKDGNKNLQDENARLREELERLRQSTTSNEIPCFLVKKGRVPFLAGDDVISISAVFKNIKEIEMIESFVNIGELKFALIYKAKRDGDKAEIFHHRVNGSVDTLVVIKTTNGNRFGGFTRESWDGNNSKRDPLAFVFSLDKLKCYECVNEEEAIVCNEENGPIFGGEQIVIGDDFTSSDGNKTGLKGAGYNTTEDFELNNGVENFAVDELEVYHVEQIV